MRPYFHEFSWLRIGSRLLLWLSISKGWWLLWLTKATTKPWLLQGRRTTHSSSQRRRLLLLLSKGGCWLLHASAIAHLWLLHSSSVHWLWLLWLHSSSIAHLWLLLHSTTILASPTSILRRRDHQSIGRCLHDFLGSTGRRRVFFGLEIGQGLRASNETVGGGVFKRVVSFRVLRGRISQGKGIHIDEFGIGLIGHGTTRRRRVGSTQETFFSTQGIHGQRRLCRRRWSGCGRFHCYGSRCRSSGWWLRRKPGNIGGRGGKSNTGRCLLGLRSHKLLRRQTLEASRLDRRRNGSSRKGWCGNGLRGIGLAAAAAGTGAGKAARGAAGCGA